jgi:hypothetical protein
LPEVCVSSAWSQENRILLVDSGGFFAGGLMDEYTRIRTGYASHLVQLKALALMRYDAVASGR